MRGPLQDAETPIDQEIVREVVELTPPSWRAAILEVTHVVESGVERTAHVIFSPEGHGEPVVPSETLFDATHRLGALFASFGRHWRKATYRIDVLEDGSAKYEVHFEY